MDCDVLVIGAGPGGCALAYALCQAGWRVVLAERRQDPTDKLCGEFLSPEGLQSLRQMGLGGVLSTFPPIGEVLVSSSTGRYWQAPLPVAGAGCSRRQLDALLRARCAAIGVEVVLGMRVMRSERTPEGYLSIALPDRQIRSRLTVGAWGRQGQGTQGERGAWMALKVHAPGVRPGVELHCFPGGYAGLSQVEDQQQNLCLLARAEAFRRVGGDHRRFIAEVMSINPLLGNRLREVNPDWSRALSAGNLRFGPAGCQAEGVLLVGDAAGAIAPLCGDGMAMALRSGELLAPLADRFLRGALSWPALAAQYARCWRAEFRLRLRLGGMMQAALLHPSWNRAAVGLLGAFPRLGQTLFRLTRGG